MKFQEYMASFKTVYQLKHKAFFHLYIWWFQEISCLEEPV